MNSSFSEGIYAQSSDTLIGARVKPIHLRARVSASYIKCLQELAHSAKALIIDTSTGRAKMFTNRKK
jgi:hypothetical protein